jgi:hypothetical protein
MLQVQIQQKYLWRDEVTMAGKDYIIQSIRICTHPLTVLRPLNKEE